MTGPSEDLTAVHFVRDGRVLDRSLPVQRGAARRLSGQSGGAPRRHHGEEAADVDNDADTFSSGIWVTGPFPGHPVPVDGDDITDLIVEHRDEIPFSELHLAFDR